MGLAEHTLESAGERCSIHLAEAVAGDEEEG
jgi:hypothetical protein